MATLPPEKWRVMVIYDDLVLYEDPDRSLATQQYLDTFDSGTGAKNYVKHFKVNGSPGVGWDGGMVDSTAEDGQPTVIDTGVTTLIWIDDGVLYSLGSEAVSKSKDLVPYAEAVAQSPPR